jgi:hypothetical protein
MSVITDKNFCFAVTSYLNFSKQATLLPRDPKIEKNPIGGSLCINIACLEKFKAINVNKISVASMD